MNTLTTEYSVHAVNRKGSSETTSINSSRSGMGPLPLLTAVALCLSLPVPGQYNFIQNQHNNGKNEVVQVVHTVSEVTGVDATKLKNLGRLEDIAKLEENWNGHGAKGFSAALIAKCRQILDTLSVQPAIYPTGRQTVHIQYELEDRSYLAFEIAEEKTTYLKVPQRKYDEAETEELTGADEAKKIKELVANFYEHSNPV